MQVRPGDQFLLEESTDRLLRIYASDRLIAHGEAVVVDGMLAVRLVDILSADPS
jgi:flagellar motor switch/type III secretory pathway protein FliN